MDFLYIIVKMFVLLKVMCKFSESFIKILMILFKVIEEN